MEFNRGRIETIIAPLIQKRNEENIFVSILIINFFLYTVTTTGILQQLYYYVLILCVLILYNELM